MTTRASLVVAGLGVLSMLGVAGAREPVPADRIDVPVRHLWKGEPLRFHEPVLAVDASHTLVLTRLEYLVSDVRLRRPDGAWVAFPEQYSHLNPNEGHSAISVEGAPAGQWTAISFAVGVDEKTNHLDPSRWPAGHALDPLESNLHWGWQGGYVFLAVEGFVHSSGSAKREALLLHIANDWNRMDCTVEFPRPSSLSDVALDFHVDRVWKGDEAIGILDGGAMTHSAKDDTFAPRLAHNVSRALAAGTRIPEGSAS